MLRNTLGHLRGSVLDSKAQIPLRGHRRPSSHEKEGTMDELFEHLIDEKNGMIDDHQIINRLVFPNHDICMNVKSALDQRGGLSFANVIPDFADFQHMDPSDRTNALLETCGSYDGEIGFVGWGYNSVKYEHHGVPSLGIPNEISKMLGIPVYYEYVDADAVLAGALIVDPQNDDNVSFANVIDKSRWAFYPEGNDAATGTLFRCGMGTMTMPDGSAQYFEDSTDPTMRALAQQGNVSLYFDLLVDQYGAKEEPSQPKPKTTRKKSSTASKGKKGTSKKKGKGSSAASGNNLDTLFGHLLEETGGRFSPQKMINRIVFPSHRTCLALKTTIDRDFGGFSLEALIPEVTDLGNLSDLQNAASCIQYCGAMGARISNVTWGFNSLMYECSGAPILRVAKELAGIINAPVYYEYIVSGSHKGGAWIVDPDDDDVSVPHAADSSQWVFYPENCPYLDETAIRCGAATATVSASGGGYSGEQEVAFKDTQNPIMQMIAKQGIIGGYFDLIESEYGSLLDDSEPADEGDDEGAGDQPTPQPEPEQHTTFGQAMGAVTYRIVFPNPECCDFVMRDLDGMYGGFSLQKICGSPDNTFDSPDEALSTLTGYGIPNDATDIEWGDNSVRFCVEPSAPNAVVIETLANDYEIPLYIEYFDELKQATGAMIAIPGSNRPPLMVPQMIGSKDNTYFDAGSDSEAYVALRCGYCQAVSDDGTSRISFVDDLSRPEMAQMANAESVGGFFSILQQLGIENVVPAGYDGDLFPDTAQQPEQQPAPATDKPEKPTSSAQRTSKAKSGSGASSSSKSAIKLWMNPIAEKHAWHSPDVDGRQGGNLTGTAMFYLEPLYRNGEQIRDAFGVICGRVSLPPHASHAEHAQVLEAADRAGLGTDPLITTLLTHDLLLPEELNALHRDIELKAQGVSAIATGRGTALERRCDSVCYLIAELRNREGNGSRRFMMWMADIDRAERVRFFGEPPAIGEPFSCRMSVAERDVVFAWKPVEGEKGFTRYKQIPEGGRVDVSGAKSDSSAMTALRKANAMFLKACGLKQTAPSKVRMTTEQAQRFTELREQLDRKTSYALTVLFSRSVLSRPEADRFLDLMERAAAAHGRGEIIDVTDTEVMEHRAIYLVDGLSTKDGTCRLYDPNTDEYRTFTFQPHLLEDFHTDLPKLGAMVNIATSLVETDLIAAWVGYNAGNAQRSARY